MDDNQYPNSLDETAGIEGDTERQLLIITDEQGRDVECEILGIFDFDGRDVIALLPLEADSGGDFNIQLFGCVVTDMDEGNVGITLVNLSPDEFEHCKRLYLTHAFDPRMADGAGAQQ